MTGAGSDMAHCGFLCKEKACRFNYIFSAYLVPFQVSRILLCSYTNALPVYNKLPISDFDLSIEFAVHCVIKEHVSYIIYFEEVVDSNYFYIVPLQGSPEGQSADPANTVDTYFNF